jgi:hypothetical protein
MTPQALLDRLVALFPEFRAYWDGPANYFRDDDGSFTLHGAFAVFSHFFRERHRSLQPDQVAALGALVSDWMASPDEALSNAAATCFVENVAGEECDWVLARHLTGEARRYWEAWGGRDESGTGPGRG